MPNNKIILSAAFVTFVTGSAIYNVGSRNATLARFPDVDRKIGKKVYAQMMRESLRGKYSDILEDEQFDKIFMSKVAALTK